MVELEPQIYNFAQNILAEFDADRLKTKEISRIQENLNKNDEEINQNSKTTNHANIQDKSDKWDKVVKKIELEEEMEEVKAKDFERQRQEYMEKMFGCSKDHSKEIDLYDKTNQEKIEHIRTMLKQANQAYDEHIEESTRTHKDNDS